MAIKVQIADVPEKIINDNVKPILSVNAPRNNLASEKHKKNADSIPEAETVSHS
ncbi:hypothetical protein D3C74_404160 [compost metagenome]